MVGSHTVYLSRRHWYNYCLKCRSWWVGDILVYKIKELFHLKLHNLWSVWSCIFFYHDHHLHCMSSVITENKIWIMLNDLQPLIIAPCILSSVLELKINLHLSIVNIIGLGKCLCMWLNSSSFLNNQQLSSVDGLFVLNNDNSPGSCWWMFWTTHGSPCVIRFSVGLDI